MSITGNLAGDALCERHRAGRMRASHPTAMSGFRRHGGSGEGSRRCSFLTLARAAASLSSESPHSAPCSWMCMKPSLNARPTRTVHECVCFVLSFCVYVPSDRSQCENVRFARICPPMIRIDAETFIRAYTVAVLTASHLVRS